MRRREFIAGCLVLSTLRGAHAEKPKRIAFVDPIVPVEEMVETASPGYKVFMETLRELGFEEGRNLEILRFSGGGRLAEFPELARKVVAHEPELIFTPSARIIKELQALTRTIPIVGLTPDPIKAGFATSLAHPGGNYTGVTVDAGIEIFAKRLSFLREAVPGIAKLGYLISRLPFEKTIYVQALQKACDEAGISVMYPIEGALLEAEYGRAFEAMAKAGVNAVFVSDQNENWRNAKLIVELAEKYRLPAVYPGAYYVEAGGLMGYGGDMLEASRAMAKIGAQILKGAKAADTPIQQAKKIELSLNLNTAKALGIEMPPPLIARADNVIE